VLEMGIFTRVCTEDQERRRRQTRTDKPQHPGKVR